MESMGMLSILCVTHASREVEVDLAQSDFQDHDVVAEEIIHAMDTSVHRHIKTFLPSFLIRREDIIVHRNPTSTPSQYYSPESDPRSILPSCRQLRG
jgi:hypothetical protein